MLRLYLIVRLETGGDEKGGTPVSSAVLTAVVVVGVVGAVVEGSCVCIATDQRVRGKKEKITRLI